MSKKKSLNKTRVFKAPVEVGRDTIKIVLPKNAADYIGLNGEEIFWAPVNGVVQISGTQPHMVIPMLTVKDDTFIPQETARAREVAEEDNDN